jgi:hypothetical protein
MLDYSFFALLFLLAQTLAPAGASRLVLENVRHPEQRMEWVREADGRWAMTINGREMGHFARDGEAVVHDPGVRAPSRFTVAELVDARDLRRDATRLRLRGSFEATVLQVSREGPALELRDPSRRLLVTTLRLRTRE